MSQQVVYRSTHPVENINIFQDIYFQNEFKDPETGKAPTTGLEFTEYNLKIQTAPLWDGKEDVGGPLSTLLRW